MALIFAAPVTVFASEAQANIIHVASIKGAKVHHKTHHKNHKHHAKNLAHKIHR
ncbi:hypothetical protein [Nostoc sp. ChiQUE02]|uniref:hypothetical protein n=1 Tax=Nostoc sp. ChiQUE02 TaxID=3075377 RepID=UPI003D160D03